MHNTIVAHDKTIHKPLPQQFFCLPSHPYFYTITSTKIPSPRPHENGIKLLYDLSFLSTYTSSFLV